MKNEKDGMITEHIEELMYQLLALDNNTDMSMVHDELTKKLDETDVTTLSKIIDILSDTP